MNALLLACQFLPLFGFLAILAAGTTERRIADISFWTTHAMGASIIGLLAAWASGGFASHEYLWLTVYSQADYHFHILFYLDEIGAAYLFCTWVIFSVIVRYCRYYLHREAGYQRFFLTIFAFVFGLNMVILSGSLDMLFAGWEIVGISSFLLIAFYRHRVQPIRNALRAYSIYRFCDIGLLIAALLSEIILHGNNHFSQLSSLFGTGAIAAENATALFTLSFFLLMAACGKSAQYPFCFWLPRAMEGPTPSSAIFYGALSVHLGVFLLLRTQPIWEAEFLSRFAVFAIGLVTVFVASVAEKTQSNIKGQIAYASIAQVGLMFAEMALGFERLVLVHFLGNAFLRCYQLLVSPSIVAHMLRVEGAADTGLDVRKASLTRSLPPVLRDILPGVLENTLVVLSLQEFNLKYRVRELLWDPLVRAGGWINGIPLRHKAGAVLAIATAGLLGVESGLLDRHLLAIPAAFAMTATSLRAFSEKHDPYKVWNDVGLSCFLAGLVGWFASLEAESGAALFYSGILPAWALGIATLKLLLRGENFAETPFVYRAMAEKKPGLAVLLFLSFLGLASFPISPAFIAEDILFYHIGEHYAWLVVLMALSFVLNGIAAAATFQRLCLGRPAEVRDTRAESAALAPWEAESAHGERPWRAVR